MDKFAGFVVYVDGLRDMEIMRCDGEPMLFNTYEDAKDECVLLDVVAPVGMAEWLAIKNGRPYRARTPKGIDGEEIGGPYHYSGPRNPLNASKQDIRPRRLREGYVYLIEAIGLNGTFKIGQAYDPHDRLAHLQCACPVELSIECIIPTRNMGETESMLHRKFNGQRVRGEWFSLTRNDVEFISHYT